MYLFFFLIFSFISVNVVSVICTWINDDDDDDDDNNNNNNNNGFV